VAVGDLAGSGVLFARRVEAPGLKLALGDHDASVVLLGVLPIDRVAVY
jgi:hypothetical protein